MSKYAWVTLATNDSYSLGALVVAHSLKRVHTVHQLAVLITPGVSEAMKTKLRNVFNVVEEVNLLDSKDEANLALLKRPELGITFTKLHCWRLTQFEKCVFLDADTLVLRNSDELFEREELSAAPDIGWPDCFNSGVYVYRPNLDTFASLLKYAVTNGSFDGGDQGLLNAYFSDWAHTDIQKHLPFIYNTSSVATYSYLPAFKHFGQNTKILHFIGVAKPWLQNFNSETRKVYVPSECQHLANFLQYWWDIFADDVHSRLSPDMQQAFSHWIAPRQQNQVSGGAQYRSAVSGTMYGGEGGAGHSGYVQWNESHMQHQQQQHQQHQQAEQREQFVPSYEPATVYVDPWEVYLRRQELEREQRKQEEERLYFQYLNELRVQEQQSREEYEGWLANQQQAQQRQQRDQHDQQDHHHGHDHHHHAHHQHEEGGDGGHHHHHQHHHQHGQHHHDANIFQRTEQWVDKMVQQHQENRGHWEQAPNEQQQSSDSGQHHHQQECADIQHTHQDTAKGDHHDVVQPNRQEEYRPTNVGGTSNVPFHPQSAGEYGGTKQDDAPPPGHPETVGTSVGHETVGTVGGSDASGLAGALAQLHMGEAKTQEQEAYEEHMRRQCWETGNIDYMGRDSFDNIWKRIQQTLGGGGTAEAAPTAAAAKAADRTPPATPRASRSRSSRSRSTTPKRDGRDRSPTPQPEDKVPLEKKEAHVVPPPAIAEEEDDSGGAGGFLSAAARSGLARRRQTRMPPPIQYDPTTNTTTLTKKVFAGYQQFITTKSPEGKTRSHTKLVYDPSVDVEEEDEPEPEPEPVQVAVVAPPARTRKTEDVVDSVPMRVARKATAVAFPNPKPAPTATPPQSQTTSTLPTNESPRSPIVPKKASPPAVTPPVQQQQVAQETLAGKPSASIEPTQPVKTVRKKRHISSLPLRPSSTATPAPTSTISADGAQSSSPSASASSRTPPPASLRKPRQPAKARVVSSSGSPDLTATPSTTKAELPLHSSSPAAHTRTTSGGKQETMTPTRTTNATQPPSSSPSSILTLRNPSSSSFRGVGLKQHDEANSVVSAAAVDDAKMTPAVPSSPPVPPRRKRESKMARLGKI